MIEVFGFPIGSISSLLTMVFSGGLLGIIARVYLGNKKLTLDAEAILRQHFGAELERMGNELRGVSAELITVRQAQRDCEARERVLQQRVSDMENKFRSYGINTVIDIGEKVGAPAAAEAAHRLKEEDGDEPR